MTVLREDVQTVPGAGLRYRLVGPERSDLPVLVFENGWAASFHMWAWVQRELADVATMLFYCRAGIGGSTSDGPRTVVGTSEQLAALLDGLGLSRPVVVVGQSHGGLIGSAHAVLVPDRVRALVQVDPTADVADPVLDSPLRAVPWIVTLGIGLATLRLPDPILSPAAADLPLDDGEALRNSAFRSKESLRAARDELSLLDELRRTAARPTPQPRMVISADRSVEPGSALGRRLLSARGRATVTHMQRSHRATAQRNGGRWETLPHTHGGLVFTRDGARDTAAKIVEFVRGLPATT